MKRKALLFSMVLTFLFMGSCTNDDDSLGNLNEVGNGGYNAFDYSTVQSVELDLNYNVEFDSKIPFEVYGEDPVENTANSAFKMRTDIQVLLKGYTALDGTYKGTVSIPAFVSKVYVYSPAFYAQTIIVADVVNGKIVATDNAEVDRANFYGEILSNDLSRKKAIADWKTYLGSFNSETGHPNYLLENATGRDEKLVLSRREYTDMYKATSKVINRDKSCPEEYRSVADMTLTEDAEVAITMLGGNTCWNNSLGYYYYRVGETPAKLSDVKIISLFPNTQDGTWSQGLERYVNKGINRGDAVKLIFYPNIQNDSKEGATTVFPEGYRIGFVLATNAWESFLGYNWMRGTKYYASSTPGLSNPGNDGIDTHTAIYQYKKNGNVNNIISFEDYKDDQNFSDVVFTLKSNPIDAITNVPVITPDENEETFETTVGGMYAFEDLWPSEGDYDMNDVICRYTNTVKKNTDNKILKEVFTFKTFANTAALTNGFGFTINQPSTNVSFAFSKKQKDAESFEEAVFAVEEEDGSTTIILSDNVKLDLNTEYKVEMTYTSAVSTVSVINPFSFRALANMDGYRQEVHLPFAHPTSKMYFPLFGTSDDRSIPRENIYYVRNGNYPFAIYLSGATENDLAPLLEISNEKQKIDELFPDYLKWVESKGTTNIDWYKQRN